MDKMIADDETLKEACSAFESEGAVVLRGAIPDGWIAALRAGVERNLRRPGPYGRRYTPDGGEGLFFGDYCNWPHIAEYRAFFEESPAAELAARLLSSKSIRIFHEHVLVKEPGTREPTPWHQDQPYYCVDGRQIVSFWIPLDPVPQETCPEFVAGSHRWGRWFFPVKFKGGAYDHRDPRLEPAPDIGAERARYRLLSWSLAPGDLIAFHALTLHGAPGNATGGERRRGFAARFLGEDAVYGERSGEVSPPFPEIVGRLKTGDPLPEDLFPTVWPRTRQGC